ncbi:MAG: carboxylating nicotinate-nucleotide diphosphorylase [Bacteroidota bacterium]
MGGLNGGLGKEAGGGVRPPAAMSGFVHDSRIARIIELALIEDAAMGDLTSEAVISQELVGSGVFLCKEDGVIAGLEVAAMVFHLADPGVSFAAEVPDGSAVSAGRQIARVDGPLREILKAERTALNFLQRMSGIATLTREFVRAVEGTGARITDTRKTAPGLRLLDKQAVRLGGGVNHRFGLDDMVLIKDNHIAAAGGVGEALRRCRLSLNALGISVPVEVETRSLKEVEEAMATGGFQRIMLDNFPLGGMRQAVRRIDGVVEVEASGGITLANVRETAETGVDFISVGALTHSVRALDICLEILPSPPA